MRVAICDDEEEITRLLERYIQCFKVERRPQEHLEIIRMSNVLELYKYLDDDEEMIDIIFLDIVLGSYNGIEWGTKLQEKKPDVKIIFITGYIQHVEEIFNCTPFALLLKPITLKKVEDVLERAVTALLSEKVSYLTVRNKEGIQNVEMKNIVYIESRGRYIELHMINTEVIKITMTMNKIEEMLNEDFVKCHRSYFINLKKIEKLSKNNVYVAGSSILPVSAANYKNVYDKFMAEMEDG